VIVSDHNIIETVTEVENSNNIDKMNEYNSIQLKMYNWYEGKGKDFEQRTNSIVPEPKGSSPHS
jgi:hypothetical protein